jgi:Flp pilus assembly protein TadD
MAQSPTANKSAQDSTGRDIGNQNSSSGGADALNPALDYIYMGGVLYNKGDFKGAISAYDKAIVLHQGANAYFFRACTERDMGDLKDALLDSTKFITLKPNDSSAYSSRALVKRDQGDLDGSLADYDRAIQLNPTASDSYEGRGLTKKLKGDVDEALADYDQAIKLNPNFPEAYERRAEARKTKGDLDGASADLALVEAFKQSGASIFVAQIDPAQAIIGQDIIVTLGLDNLHDEKISLPPVGGLEVIQYTVSENKKEWPMSSTFTHRFILHATHPGKFIIPAFDIQSSQTSKILHVQPLRMDVLDKPPPKPLTSPINPNQQVQKTGSTQPLPNFQLNKSDIAGLTNVPGDNTSDADATELGRYKAKIYLAVGSVWYAKVKKVIGILPVGEVRIQYTIHSDGTVSNIKVLEGSNNTLQLLLSISRNSIAEASPYNPFTNSLRKEITENQGNNGESFTDDFTFSIYSDDSKSGQSPASSTWDQKPATNGQPAPDNKSSSASRGID